MDKSYIVVLYAKLIREEYLMTAHKSVRSIVKISLLAFVIFVTSPVAANSQICTDVDQDGATNFLDITYLYDYMFKGGPPPPDPWSANVDGFELITMADFNFIFRRHFAGYAIPSCSVLYPPIIPIYDSAILLSHTQWLDSGVSDAVIIIEVSNDKILTGLILVFDMYIGNEATLPDSFRLCTPTQQSENCFSSVRIDNVQDSVIMIPYEHLIDQLNPLYRFYLYTTVTPSIQRRPISIEFTHTSPAQANPPDSSLITMMVGQFEFSPFTFDVWEPVITCCFQDRGDLNGDGHAGNILDLTHLVDYIFRGSGDAGNCPDEADINNDGASANILDLTTIVDYIFRGGGLTSCYE